MDWPASVSSKALDDMGGKRATLGGGSKSPLMMGGMKGAWCALGFFAGCGSCKKSSLMWIAGRFLELEVVEGEVVEIETAAGGGVRGVEVEAKAEVVAEIEVEVEVEVVEVEVEAEAAAEAEMAAVEAEAAAVPEAYREDNEGR